MNWEVLNRLLGMTTVWSDQSLILVLDKETIPPPAYASPAPGREGGAVLRPGSGAGAASTWRAAPPWSSTTSISSRPSCRRSRARWRSAWAGKVQANLYLSSKRKQGFQAHFDFHDVFAMHVMGEKTWTVFQGRADYPIKHPMFEGWPRERHEQLKGELWREVRLRPGDLLYLPRGQYHYALADDGPCVHIAWGVTYPIGMDVVSYAFERMVGEAVGRANLPRDRAGLQARLAEIGRRSRAKLG